MTENNIRFEEEREYLFNGKKSHRLYCVNYGRSFFLAFSFVCCFSILHSIDAKKMIKKKICFTFGRLFEFEGK